MNPIALNLASYNSLLSRAISRYIRHGIPRSEAVQKAHQQMQDLFYIDEGPPPSPQYEPSPILQREAQADQDDQANGDWTR